MDGWLDRLRFAMKADGRSARAVSIAAGLGPNYLSELLLSKKEPGIEKFLRICQELHVSSSYVLTGTEVSQDAEEMLGILASLPAEEQETLFRLARQLKAARS